MRARIRRFAPLAVTLLLLLAVPLIFVACTSTTWLPDSSGFVHVDAGGNVVLHDIKKKSRKVITRTELRVSDATVSPNGKEIVVARAIGRSKKEGDIRFDYYDLVGNRTHTSKPCEVPLIPSTSPGFIRVETSSDKRHSVAFLIGSNMVVVYDKKTKQHRVIKDVTMIPGHTPAWPVQVQHMSPDGKGFVAIRGLGVESPKLAYFRWDQQEPIAVGVTKDLEDLSQHAPFEGNSGVLTRPVWKKGMLVSRFYKGLLRFDVKNRKLDYIEDKMTAKLAEHAEKHKVTVIAELADGALLQIKAKEIQLFRPGKEVIPLMKTTKQSSISLVPSPDGKYVFARSYGEHPILRVVSVSGETIVLDAKQ